MTVVQLPDMLPNGAVAVGSEACELQVCYCHRHSRIIAALQVQVALPDDALDVTIGVCKLRVGGYNLHSRIVIWRWPGKRPNRASALVKNARGCRPGCGKYFCRMMLWQWPINCIPEHRLGDGQK